MSGSNQNKDLEILRNCKRIEKVLTELSTRNKKKKLEIWISLNLKGEDKMSFKTVLAFQIWGKRM